MTWHFDYTVPSLIFLSFFLIFYFLKPIRLTKANRCFLFFIITEVLGFSITYFSSLIDINSASYSRCMLYLSNDLYYIFYIGRYFIISHFFALMLHVNVKKDVPTIITGITTIAVLMLVLITPYKEIIYGLGPNGEFIRAKYYYLAYIANYIILLLDFYYIIKNRKKLNAKEFISALFIVVALVACSLIDNLYMPYLITDMFFLFVILILYMAFENPDIYIDKKTGLFNIPAFYTVTNDYLYRHKKFYIISFNIQNYSEKKQIYGTKRMDKALKEIGKFFQSLFHDKKYFYIQNGRFVIIDKSTNDFEKMSDKIIERFKQPWIVNNSELHLNIVVINMADDINFHSIEDISIGFNMAVDEAKKQTSSSITINKESIDKIKRKTNVAKALNKAILEDSLLVYLQPVVDCSTEKVVGAEALVRIDDKKLGLIPPAEFIPMAEQNGSIDQLGEQVLNKVCIYLRESNIYKYGIKWINVNLSPVQCQNNKLQQKIDDITNSNTIDHNYIHLEITEESIIDTPILKNQMNLLITDGYKFCLDDFGSGFSNISRVKSLPFYNLKLDMSIVWDHFNAPDDMLPNIVKTFRSKGFSVTAEGVETKEMAESLKGMGCNYLQGYYYSKPVPMIDFKSSILQINSLN